MRYLKQKLYCYRMGRSIPIITEYHDSEVGVRLGLKHRALVAKLINDYDVFIYQEDDLMLEYSHLVAYLHETKLLEEKVLRESTITARYIG